MDRRVWIVFLGGGLGSCIRALLLNAAPGGTATQALAVLVINLAGASAIGLVYALADEAELLGSSTRLFLTVGLLGGFTTFSAFSWGIDSLVAGGQAWLAVGIALVSLGGGPLSAIAGMTAGREGVALLERRDRRRIGLGNSDEDESAGGVESA